MKWPVTLALALVLAVLQLTAATAAPYQPAAANVRNHAASRLGTSGLSVASSSGAASAAAPQQQQHMQTPLICTAMLSYNRPHYLVPAVRAFVAYMVAVEPDITWTLQVLDNGSGPKALANITQQLAPLRAAGHAVRLVHLERNIGLSRGFNVLFFDMCASTGAPYILSLEDDWRARSEQWSAGFPVLQASMQALQRHDSLLEVWLRDHHQKFIFHKPAEWQLENFTLPGSNSPTATPGQQLQLNVLHLTCINERGNPWGGYSNGASLKHAQRLRALGHMPGTDGEAAISKRSCRKGYHVAYICQETSCFEPVKQWHDGLFEHLGTARVPASMDARSNKAAVARKGLFSGPDTLANLKHQVIISTLQGNSISAPCDEAAAASFAAASSSRGVGLQLKQQQQQLLSRPPSVVWQQIKSSSGSGKVFAAVLLAGFAACAVVWLAAAKSRLKVKDAYYVRSV